MADKLSLIEPVVGEEEIENIREVLDSGYMTQGPFADQLEERIADIVGVDHGITATSCTTGMQLVLEAYDIGPGDEVIVPDFTYPATAQVVERVGADTVLVDVEPDTFNIDPDAVRQAITEDTAAVMPVCWGGQPLETRPLNEIADEHDVLIIEDAAWGFGARYGDDHVGSQFDASIFSFHPRKAITTGEGGLITLDDDEIAEEIRCIKNFGIAQGDDRSGFIRDDGTNFRLSDVLAAIGVAQLEKHEEIFERRREMAAQYNELVEPVDGIRKPFELEEAYHTYGSYCVYVEAGDDGFRDTLIDAMADENIETQIGTYSLHKTDAFADAERGSSLDVSRDLYHNLLTLPMEQSMTVDDQERVVETLESLLSNAE